MIDFNKIVLTPMDEKILDSLSCFEVAKINQYDAAHLVTLGFIGLYAFAKSDDEHTITGDGILYLKHKEELEAEKNKALQREKERQQVEEKRFKKENIREWIGIFLSNGLSLAALVVSIIALLFELKVLPLKTAPASNTTTAAVYECPYSH